MSLDILIAEYPGDPAWRRFVNAVGAPAAEGGPRSAGDDLNQVLTAEMGVGGEKWLNCPARVLDGRTPAELIANHPQGLLAVRSALMRMAR